MAIAEATQRTEGFGYKRFLEPLIMSSAEIEHVYAAYVLAKYGHRDQTRESGGRYFDHPKEVANIIIRELGIRNNWRLVVTALLHDILEDTYLLSEDRIRRNFGKKVALWVNLLSKVPKEGYHERLAACGIWEVLLVKLCDRIHNLRTLNVCDKKKQKKYLQETKALYVPLADALIARVPSKHAARAEYVRAQLQFFIIQIPSVL